MKYQGVMSPKGAGSPPYFQLPLLARMYHESGFVDIFEAGLQAAQDDNLCVAGDSAYARSPRLEKPWPQKRLTPAKKRANKFLKKARVCVENGFGSIVNLWPYIDHAKNMKSFLSPIALWVEVAVLLTNLNACFYGNVVCSYYGCQPPTPEEYLRLPQQP